MTWVTHPTVGPAGVAEALRQSIPDARQMRQPSVAATVGYVSVLTGQAMQREATDPSGSSVRRWCTRAGPPVGARWMRWLRRCRAGLVSAATKAALESAQGEIERLRATVTEQAVELHLHEGMRLRTDRRRGRRGWTRR